MKRVRRAGISKGKKIAGLVILCLAVVLGYFGYHRLTAHADQYIHHGVINDISELPTDTTADEGTDGNPFLILEIVPSAAEASIGYMVDGCAPIQFDDLTYKDRMTALYSNVGWCTTTVFDEEFEDFDGTDEEKKIAFPGYDTGQGWQKYNDPREKTVYGYYEKVGQGQGYFQYTQNQVDAKDSTKYNPVFVNVGKGNGDFIWVSCTSEDEYYNFASVFDSAIELENLDRPTAQDELINFKEGEREYTTRRDSTHYYWSATYRGVHQNAFLRVSLGQNAGCYTREQIKNFRVVVKTIEPRELKDYPEWIDYADLIYMSTSGSTMQNNWNTYTDAHAVRWEYNGTETPITATYGTIEDFSWRVARNLFMKVNALEKYDGNGEFRFAPIILTNNTVKEANTTNSPSGTTINYLDYTTMKSVEYKGSESQGCDRNIWKFLVMDLSMNQEMFYDLFFKNEYKNDEEEWQTVIPEEPDINNNIYNEIGTCRAQNNDNAKTYWGYNTFLPVGLDSNYSETVEFYNIHPQMALGMGIKDGQLTVIGDNSNSGLSGATYMFNSDNLVAQLSNTASIKKNQATQAAFDWYYEQYGIELDSMSFTQLIEYLLNYKKKGSSDENERDRNQLSLRILEVEPCNDFIWKDTDGEINATSVAAFFPSSRFDVTVDCMTTQELNGVKTDLSSDYDIIYIGMTTGKFNLNENSTLPEWNNESDFVNYNDAIFNANQNYLLAGKIYLHVGDLIKDASNKKLRISGNDISTIKLQKLKSFSKTGVLILEDTLQAFKTKKYTRLVDSASNMNSLIKEVYDKENVAAYSTLVSQAAKLTEILSSTKTAYKSQMEIVSTPPEYVTSDGSTQSLESSILNFTFKINQLDSDEFKKKFDMDVPDGVNGKKFGIKLYMDLDYDGLITDNGETSEVVYDSQTDASTYDMPAKYEASTETYEFSLDFAKILEDRRMEARKNGAVTWRFVIYDIDDEDYYISKTGTSYYHGSSQKRSIRFYQIVADNEALNSNANLMKQSLEGNSLFHKYTSDLADYEINSSSETVTLAEYIQKYQTEIASIQDEMEKLLVFQDVDMIIVSCAQKMQTEAANYPDAINFIKTLADSGISVLYTTEAASRDKVMDAELVSNNMKNMMNQSRFTDYSVYYQDNTGYSQGKTTTDGQLATTASYSLSDYKSLEYTYKAAMQAGSDDNNDLMCFRDSLWEENNISYGISNNAAKTNKITEVNAGKLTTYPYNINDADVNTSGTVAQDFQLNMNNPNMVVWYCLGDEDNSLYGISPNDATNNYYLYTVGNVAYTSADLGAMTDDEEMKLFVNTLIANYDVGALYPRVVVNAVKGIHSVDKDGVVADSSQFANTNSTLYFDALMSQLQSAYSDYAENAANTTPIPVVTEEPDTDLDPAETLPPDPEEDSSGGVSGSIQQPVATPSVNENDSSIVHNPDKVKKVADTDDGSYIPTGKDYTHKIYFTPFDSNAPGGNIHSLRISLVDKAANGGEDDVYQYIGTIYHQDLVTGHVFEYTASSSDYTFTVTKGNFTQDSQEYFFLYKEKYMLTKFDYVKFEIANDKRTGITYLHPYNEVKADNTYVFPLD